MSERDETSYPMIGETQFPDTVEEEVPNFADDNSPIVSQFKDNFTKDEDKMSPEFKQRRSATPEISEDDVNEPAENKDDNATDSDAESHYERVVPVKVPSTSRSDSPGTNELSSSTSKTKMAMSLFNTTRNATQDDQDDTASNTAANNGPATENVPDDQDTEEDDDLPDATPYLTSSHIEAGVSMEDVERQPQISLSPTSHEDADVPSIGEVDASEISESTEAKEALTNTGSRKRKSTTPAPKSTSRSKVKSTSKASKKLDVEEDADAEETSRELIQAEDLDAAEEDRIMAEPPSSKRKQTRSTPKTASKSKAKSTSKSAKTNSKSKTTSPNAVNDGIDDDDTAVHVEGIEVDEVTNEPSSKKRKRSKSEPSATKPTSTSKATAKSTPTSSSKATPASKTGRKTSSSTSTPTLSSAAKSALKICFSGSTTPTRPNIMKNFMALGHKEVKQVTKSCDVLVVGNGDMLKTAKVLMAVALGKQITTDKWVTDCATKNETLDLNDFPPKDSWGVSYAEDIHGKTRMRLFKGHILLVTPALKKEYGSAFQDIEALAKAVGCTEVVSKPARNMELEEGKHIVIGKETEDADTIRFLDMEATVYTKDFLTYSILRNELDLTSKEFRIGEAPAKRRKSGP